MNTVKQCPTCSAKHSVPIDHEFEKLDGRPELTLYFESQSTQLDGAKLEAMFPQDDDGSDLIAEPEWVDRQRGIVRLKLTRKPRQAKAGTPAPTAKKALSRADMETKAAEMGLEVNPKWTDDQLRVALEKKLEAKIK